MAWALRNADQGGKAPPPRGDDEDALAADSRPPCRRRGLRRLQVRRGTRCGLSRHAQGSVRPHVRGDGQGDAATRHEADLGRAGATIGVGAAAEFAKFVHAEIEKWGKVVRDAGSRSTPGAASLPQKPRTRGAFYFFSPSRSSPISDTSSFSFLAKKWSVANTMAWLEPRMRLSAAARFCAPFSTASVSFSA